ncbi:MAG TPA: prepilin peptidase, partial [Burkholderiales bacterium]|nr:prepilin peptidase [Burkholderiales bacterium]
MTTRKLQPGRIVQAVNAHGDALHTVAASVLDGKRNCLRERLRQEGFSLDVVAQVFALIRECAARTLDMRPFDVQLIGGWIMVNGMIAEMDTGEGKTLTATLPACTAALAGMPVHILTVNDYLAQRDAELMTPLYRALGLSVGIVTHEMDLHGRRAAYACDVVYCTNKELVFDYLRDRIVRGRKPGPIHLQLDRLLAEPKSARLRLRGLHFAIVDEADSILIDEARTPLIISNQGDDRKDGELYTAALEIAAQLESDRDFELDERARAVDLTRAGRARVAEVGAVQSGVWKGGARGEELVRQALTAQYVMQRDLHYIVKEDKVQIIDDNTGRVMGDRSWEHGLHQMIEIKEGCSLTAQNDPVSRITYQRFFR